MLLAAYALACPTAWAQEKVPLPERPKRSLDAQAEPFDPERGVPAGYHMEQGVRKWLVISGGALLVASYGLGLVKAAGTGASGDNNGVLLLPFAGPFIYIAESHEAVWAVVGAGQIIGAAAFILGLTMKVPWIVPDEQTAVHVAPMRIGRYGYGGALNLSF